MTSPSRPPQSAASKTSQLCKYKLCSMLSIIRASMRMDSASLYCPCFWCVSAIQDRHATVSECTRPWA